MMLQRPGRLAAFAVLAGLFFAGPSLVRYYTDWLWFGEVGYQQVFFTMLRAQGTLFTVAFVLSTVWLTVNFRTAVATIRDLRQVFTTREGIEVPLPGRSQLRALASGIAVVVSVLVALFASSQWETWLTWPKSTDDVTPQELIVYCMYINGVPDGCQRDFTRAIMYGVPMSRNTYKVTATDRSGNTSESTIEIDNF